MPKINNIIEKGLYSTKVPLYTNEFITLLSERLQGVTNYLEPTLNSLAKQTHKDFELIISHRYPEEVKDVVKEYDFPIKLVKEKHSIWHDLGSKYGTLCNNINTAFIQSQGELLWRLDDLTLFNDNAMAELWDMWKQGCYATSRGVRCIEYDDNQYRNERYDKLGPHKVLMEGYGWHGEIKALSEIRDKRVEIGRNMCWGFSSTVSAHDFLLVNGQDELYDGSICGTDMDLGDRLTQVSNTPRFTTMNYVYELNDVNYKYMMRDDVAMRQLWHVRHVQGNTWKPDERQMRTYARWHKKNVGELDPNWNKFLTVPELDLKEEYRLKRLGEVVWTNQ